MEGVVEAQLTERAEVGGLEVGALDEWNLRKGRQEGPLSGLRVAAEEGGRVRFERKVLDLTHLTSTNFTL